MDEAFICQICGQEPTAIVRSFEKQPFIDGRNYPIICWRCACVPKYWYLDREGYAVMLTEPDPDNLHSVAEMMDDGWTKSEAQTGIKAIQRKLKAAKVRVYFIGPTIFAQLFLEPTKRMELSSVDPI